MSLSLKSELRVLAIDDGPHSKWLAGQQVPLVGVVYRGAKFFDGIAFSWVTVDGLDANEAILDLLNSLHRSDIRLLLLDGITYAGFNVVDLPKLYEESGLPVIAFLDHYPNLERIHAALEKHFPDWKLRYLRVLSAGKIYELKINDTIKFFQVAGLQPRIARKILRKLCVLGPIPEPLRVANTIASSLGKWLEEVWRRGRDSNPGGHEGPGD
jgi:endonuclease V-like protein UPF0215 family